MKTRLRRVLSLVLALCLCLMMLPTVALQAEAASYYSESDLGNVKSTIISNSARASYVNDMMRHHILSSTDNYRVARNLKDGKSIVFFFDGCSDNVDDSTYGDYTQYHLSAYCAVVEEVSGVLKVVYESENCSTIPDNPRNASLNDETAVPTVLDGVYNITSINHLGKYAALHISNNSGVAPAIRCNSTSSYVDSSTAINIHARSKFSGVPHNGIGPNTYSSTGCFNVGLTNDSWAEYNNFIYAVLGVSNARNVTLSSTWVDKGLVIVDRSHYKSQLAAIYGGDNNHSAEGLVAKITQYTDNLGYTTHIHSYSGSHYEAAHPHKVYQKCSCGATQYTGATTTVSTCETCNPISTSSKYNAVLSFKGYLKGTSKVYPYTTAQMVTASGGEIWSTDECTISAVYSNGACKVTYPVGSGTKTAYTQLSNFIGDTSASLTRHTVSHKATTYIRASTGSTVYGYIDVGDVIYKLGTSGGMTQIFYPTSSGYKLAWVVTSELTAPTYDNRFNPYCPIKGYPCATSDFNVYDSDKTTVTGEIWATDYCTINAVYADGWCQVSYPAGSTTKTAYTQLSNFVYNVSANHIKYTANAQVQVHKNQSLPGDMKWYISSGDQFFAVGSYGSASQVLYPIDAQYGGGYKLGWISTANLPKTTYTVSYNANGGSGAPSSQTKTHGVALTLSSTVPTRSGYAFVGWATSSSATAATYAPGSSYTTDASLTLYAVWTLNKYEITYNTNGGTNAPISQNKAHGTNLTLSTAVPTKHYAVTFNANGGTVDVSSRQIACKFLGWATSSTATTATYQPGGTFTTNANTTLYAVWQNNALGAYSIPVREGYVFEGWYTAASGGTPVTLSTTVSSNITVYAHWVVATYGVNYDANGGTGAPESQIKTHGQALTLSNIIPTRENYTFLGWGTEENPTSVQYRPGDSYTADSDAMLIAVWSFDLEPTIAVGITSGKPGDLVTVPIRVEDNPGIIAARLKITYNADVLTLVEVQDGGILGEYVFGGNLNANPYVVTWENGLATSNFTGTGDLVTLNFVVSEDAPEGSYDIEVAYDAEEIYNMDLVNVAFDVEQGSVTVATSIKKYIVSFNANGGSGAPSNQTKTHGTPLTLSSTTPARPGYTFIGWSTSSSATSATYAAGDAFTINANTTLYAVWESVCGENHTFFPTAIVKEAPTETKNGTILIGCARCGYSEEITLPSLITSNTDTYTYSIITPATCISSGIGRYTWNSDDFMVTPFDVTIPQTEHNYGQWEITLESTSSTVGKKERTCTICGDTQIDTIPATEGTVTPPEETNPTEPKPTTPPAEDDQPAQNPFTDVPEDAFYHDPVLWAVDNSITNGVDDTHFGPDAGCTRAHVVTFLWRAAGKPVPSSSYNPFVDVTPGSYYYDAVLWAVEKGITNGTSASTFAPDQTCTRGQIVTFLWRYQHSPSAPATNSFTDVPVGQYYSTAVAWAVANGITNGMGGGIFAPDATCTRGQIVTFLYRAIKTNTEKPVAPTEPQPTEPEVDANDEIVEVASGIDFYAILKSNGKVDVVSWNDTLKSNLCADWIDIVDIDVNNYFVLGLQKNGSVVFKGVNVSSRGDVSDWSDIKQVSAGGFFSAGLKTNGTVVAVGSNDDGECNVSDWTDIIAITTGSSHTVGLKADGTVVATGSNHMGQCDVAQWSDIIAIAAGDGITVGLKADGTVVTTCVNWSNSNPAWTDIREAQKWTDIIAIDAGGEHIAALKSDGTVITAGFVSKETGSWIDVTAISAGNHHTVGLKGDGTIIVVKQPEGT